MVKLFLSFLLCLSCQAASVTLAWDASPDTSVVGYHLCYGTKSATVIIRGIDYAPIGTFYRPEYQFTNTVNAQTLTNRVYGLSEGQTYYFAVAAFDANGNVSDFSNEVQWTGEANLQIRRKIKMRVRL